MNLKAFRRFSGSLWRVVGDLTMLWKVSESSRTIWEDLERFMI